MFQPKTYRGFLIFGEHSLQTSVSSSLLTAFQATPVRKGALAELSTVACVFLLGTDDVLTMFFCHTDKWLQARMGVALAVVPSHQGGRGRAQKGYRNTHLHSHIWFSSSAFPHPTIRLGEVTLSVAQCAHLQPGYNIICLSGLL